MSKIGLEKLALGGVQERFEAALQLVAENIADERTDPDAKRKVVITVTVDPSGSQRGAARVLVDVEAKLQNHRPIPASIAIGKNSEGLVVAREMVQQTIFDFDYSREKQEQKKD